MRFSDPSVHPIDRDPLPAPARFVVDSLRDHVTEARFERIVGVARGRTLGVVPVLDNVADPHNASAILRSCDAFGVHEVHVIADERRFLGTKKVTRGTDRWLELVDHASPEAAVDALHAKGYRIYVASMEGEHTPESLASVDKVAVVFGNERRGVSEALRAHADGTYRVPMVGFVESLNVSVAAAVTLYTLTRSRPRVDDAEADAVIARLLIASVTDARRIVEEKLERQDGQDGNP